jgi:hypothetical protein
VVEVLAQVSDEGALRALSASSQNLQHIALGSLREQDSDEGFFVP